MKIAEALRLLRTRQGLTQTAASKREGAPDFRTLSHWETRRKMPSLLLLHRYLTSLGLDFRDLQESLDQVEGNVPKRLQDGLEKLEQRLGELERHVGLVKVDPPQESEEPPESPPSSASKR